MTTDTLTIAVGDRVRLVDAGGDASSSARVGDIGTARTGAVVGHDLLMVDMDSGHTTSRNASRWEKVEEAKPYNTFDVTGEESSRDAWRALPIEVAYPIGSLWVHPSHSTPVKVVGHSDDGRNVLVDYCGPEAIGNDGRNAWPRTALDTYGRMARPEDAWIESVDSGEFTPGQRVRILDTLGTASDAIGHEVTYVGPSPRNSDPFFDPYEVEFDAESPYTQGFIAANARRHLYVRRIEPVESEATTEATEPEEAPETPYVPAIGDRVIVTDDSDSPEDNGKSATVSELSDRAFSGIRVTYDYDGHGWWVTAVRPEMPSTPEEFRMAIERAKEQGLRDGVTAGKREGREEATREFNEWKQSAQATAHDYAYNNSLCREFDKCMVAIGLEPRDSFTQEYRVDVTYTVYVEVKPDDSAAIRNAAMEKINDGYESPEIDWEEN